MTIQRMKSGGADRGTWSTPQWLELIDTIAGIEDTTVEVCANGDRQR